MRGQSDRQNAMIVPLNLEDLVRADDLSRALKRMADAGQGRLYRHFSAADARTGRPSIPPE